MIKTLCPVYSLIFADFTMFEELRNYYLVFLLKSEEQPEVVFSHHLGIILVELEKFKDKSASHLIDKKDLWTYFIKSSKEQDSCLKRNVSKRYTRYRFKS